MSSHPLAFILHPLTFIPHPPPSLSSSFPPISSPTRLSPQFSTPPPFPLLTFISPSFHITLSPFPLLTLILPPHPLPLLSHLRSSDRPSLPHLLCPLHPLHPLPPGAEHVGLPGGVRGLVGAAQPRHLLPRDGHRRRPLRHHVAARAPLGEAPGLRASLLLGVMVVVHGFSGAMGLGFWIIDQ